MRIAGKENLPQHRENMPSVLFWGRTDRNYSRNRIVCELFADLGWQVDFFHPLSSRTGLIEAFMRPLQRPTLIWVPCFRHRDMLSASFWARKWQVPLVFDPLISAYEKEVFERRKWAPDSARARQRRQWESKLMAAATVVVADTPAHADYFHHHLLVARDRLQVLYVGAERRLFQPAPYPPCDRQLEVFFSGAFCICREWM